MLSWLEPESAVSSANRHLISRVMILLWSTLFQNLCRVRTIWIIWHFLAKAVTIENLFRSVRLTPFRVLKLGCIIPEPMFGLNILFGTMILRF